VIIDKEKANKIEEEILNRYSIKAEKSDDL
jgi:hypothetical protein